MKKLLIIGAGGHAKVVYDLASHWKEIEVIGFADDSKQIGTAVIENCKVLSTIDGIHSIHFDHFIVAIGDNAMREKIFNKFNISHKPISLIHPSAVVSRFAIIGNGSLVLSNSTIQVGCTIGDNVIINANCMVDHDSIIGKNVHLSQGTIVGSECSISDNFTSKMGQLINSRTKI